MKSILNIQLVTGNSQLLLLSKLSYSLIASCLFVFVVAGCNSNKDPHAHEKQDTVKQMYTCPMPQDSVFSDKPGKCPKCGMELVKMEQPAAQQDHDHESAVAEYTCPM